MSSDNGDGPASLLIRLRAFNGGARATPAVIGYCDDTYVSRKCKFNKSSQNDNFLMHIY